MDLRALQKEVMDQAKEKGFGTKPEEIVVSEKIVLIHSEISEGYQAYLVGNLDGRGGFYEEIGDSLQRVLHLGGIFGVDFPIAQEVSWRDFPVADLGGKVAVLHSVVSAVWENYRRGRLEEFKTGLVRLAWFIALFASDFNFSLAEAIEKKLVVNQGRDWQQEAKPNEKFISN